MDLEPTPAAPSAHDEVTSPTEESEPENRQHADILHDSMVTVRLSEPPALTVDTTLPAGGYIVPQGKALLESPKEDVSAEAEVAEDTEPEQSPRITMMDVNGDVRTPTGSESGESRRGSDSTASGDDSGVNWEELEKTEEQEPRDESSDDSTALLLARLDQENNLLATNPKSGIAKSIPRPRTDSRPPSIQTLKKMVNGPTPSALRYSMIPAPPMTDLEFYAALVQDYTRTAQCLPTLLSKKIRSGIPPPLRGVVWQSMSGARDALLEDQFDRLSGESSPYEGIIGKDLGRSFPGVEMFRDPQGDGQRMLGRVLKCFSLYDHKIGYCQGLGFLVGPLLMHMGDKQAFCVLVRLMEHYDLRSCFLPDLSGLHVRIYQFQQLLKTHLPDLSNHLDALQIEPAYVSQWFLSFFAVTCPLPMLFRIYDVIFAEGASETIMRVALSLMRKNEEKIMACTEFEDVMQLLLSRGLWDVYHYNADEFVNDFVGLTGVVTNEILKVLEMSYKEAQVAEPSSENVGSAATRFLGRLWMGSSVSTKSMNLTAGLSAPARPVSFLRRSPSKQSIASTLNSIEYGGSDSMLSSSTDNTSISRDSSNTDGSSIRAQSVGFNNTLGIPSRTNKDKNLHSQIEDLLTALSELQRDHAVLANELQREREEREEDRRAVRSLLDGLRKKSSMETVTSTGSENSQATVKPAESFSDDDVKVVVEEVVEDENETVVPESESPDELDTSKPTLPVKLTTNDFSHLLEVVEARFSPSTNRRSSMLQTKSQLRTELAQVKERLLNETLKTTDFSRRLSDQHQEISNLNDQVKEKHSHIRNFLAEKQRLEKQIHDLRTRKSVVTTPEAREGENEWPTTRSSGFSGLRELKLRRTNSRNSSATTFNKRSSSLATGMSSQEHNMPPVVSHTPHQSQESSKTETDVDALLLQLVQAKTAEAVAKQETEEAKSKLESLRKMLGAASPNADPVGSLRLGHKVTASQASALGFGFGKATTPPATVPGASAGGSGFWGGWGKRAVSSSSVGAAE